jgi:SAM-dependent methyltransferase
MPFKTKRWVKAQNIEYTQYRSFYRQIGFHDRELNNDTQSRAISTICKHTGNTAQQLKDMRILEIGGHLIELAFEDINNPPKLILDPLLIMPKIICQQSRAVTRLRGIGEFIPLKNSCIDLCWTTNTIDHTLAPAMVLKEAHRILTDKGILIISCNVFPNILKPVFPLVNVVDRPHPHHFTSDSLRTLLIENGFRIVDQDDNRLDIKKDYKDLPLLRNIKLRVAVALGIHHIYYKCIKADKEKQVRN